MGENYLLACANYIEMNPLRAGLVKRARDWPWSSVKAHIRGQDDLLVKVKPLLELTGENWNKFLVDYPREEEIELLKKHERTGRPLGSKAFVNKIEILLERLLQPQKVGRKKMSMVSPDYPDYPETMVRSWRSLRQ
jgi:putative transposase